jgi:hypothetical protein
VGLHEAWHIALLATTLTAAAGVVIVTITPLLFGGAGRLGGRARAAVFCLVGLAAVLLLVEWLVVHGRFI